MKQFHQNTQQYYHHGHNSYNNLSNEGDYYSHGGPQTSTNNPHQMNPVTVIVRPSGQHNF